MQAARIKERTCRMEAHSQHCITTAKRTGGNSSTGNSPINCILTWSSEDSYIKCLRLSNGDKMYDYFLGEESDGRGAGDPAARDNPHAIIANMAMLPQDPNQQNVDDSEVTFWAQDEHSVNIYRLSHVVARLAKTPSSAVTCWSMTCRALPPAPKGRRTSRTVVFMDDGSLCMISSITGQVLTVCHSITLADNKVIDLDVRQDGFVMHVVLENGVIFELDICASPATRLAMREPERTSEFALCVATQMISVITVPLYEPPTFIGMENGNIQILPHKYCRMPFFHAHQCEVVGLSSPVDYDGHPDCLISCGSDGTLVLWNILHSVPADLSQVNLALKPSARLRLEFAPITFKMVTSFLTVLTHDGDVRLYWVREKDFEFDYSDTDSAATSGQPPVMPSRYSRALQLDECRFEIVPVPLDDSFILGQKAIAIDISITGQFYVAAWPNGLIRIWSTLSGDMLKELKSGRKIQGLSLVEQRDLLIVQPCGQLCRIKAEHYLPLSCIKNLLRNSIDKDDWIEEPLPELLIETGDVAALTKICKEAFEVRRDRFKHKAANKAVGLMDWMKQDSRSMPKKRYINLVEKLKERKARILKFRQEISQKAMKVAKLKAGRVRRLDSLMEERVTITWNECWNKKVFMRKSELALVKRRRRRSSAFKKTEPPQFGALCNSIYRRRFNIKWRDPGLKRRRTSIKTVKKEKSQVKIDPELQALLDSMGNVEIKSIDQILKEEAEARRNAEAAAQAELDAIAAAKQAEADRLVAEQQKKEEAERLKREAEEAERDRQKMISEDTEFSNFDMLPNKVIPRITKRKSSKELPVDITFDIDPGLLKIYNQPWFPKEAISMGVLKKPNAGVRLASVLIDVIKQDDDIRAIREAKKSLNQLMQNLTLRSANLTNMLKDFFKDLPGHTHTSEVCSKHEKVRFETMSKVAMEILDEPGERLECAAEIVHNVFSGNVNNKTNVKDLLAQVGTMVNSSITLADVMKAVHGKRMMRKNHEPMKPDAAIPTSVQNKINRDLAFNFENITHEEDQIKQLLIENGDLKEEISVDFEELTHLKVAETKLRQLRESLAAEGVANPCAMANGLFDMAFGNLDDILELAAKRTRTLDKMKKNLMDKQEKLEREREEAAAALRNVELEEPPPTFHEVIREAIAAEKSRREEAGEDAGNLRLLPKPARSKHKLKREVKFKKKWRGAVDETKKREAEEEAERERQRLRERRRSMAFEPTKEVSHTEFDLTHPLENSIVEEVFQRKLETSTESFRKSLGALRVSDIDVDAKKVSSDFNRRRRASIYSMARNESKTSMERKRLKEEAKIANDYDMKGRLQRMNRPVDVTVGRHSYKEKIAEYKRRHPEKAQLKRHSQHHGGIDFQHLGDGIQGKLNLHGAVERASMARHSGDLGMIMNNGPVLNSFGRGHVGRLIRARTGRTTAHLGGHVDCEEQSTFRTRLPKL